MHVPERGGGPRFSVVTAVHDPPAHAFADTVASVLGQHHDDWEWVLVDDASTDPLVRERLVDLARREPRVRVVLREANGGIAAASQDALAAATGEFVVLLDHDDVLVPEALEVLGDTLDRAPDADYVYSDQDAMSAEGELGAAFRKPDWSPERLRHHNYLTHLSCVRRSLATEVGGFRTGYDGSQDHDLLLRVTERARRVEHVRRVLYHWRRVPGSAGGDPEAKPWAWDAGVRAVQSHLDRVGVDATCTKGRVPGTYRLTRRPDLATPTSVVVTAPDALAAATGLAGPLLACVRSALASTRHTALEVVVVVAPDTPGAVLAELSALSAPSGPSSGAVTVRALALTGTQSRRRNLGALHATGERLLFLDHDAEAVSPGVVEDLVTPLGEPGVGACGAKLLTRDGRIEHAGVVYGSGAVAPAYHHRPADASGVHGELWVNREVSALGGACVAVTRRVFEDVGGFSEVLPDRLADVDLSLKIRRSGRRLLWLHGAVLHHDGDPTGRSAVDVGDPEAEPLLRRWGDPRQVPERYVSNVDRVLKQSAAARARSERSATPPSTPSGG